MEFILLLEDLMGREIMLEQLSVDQFRTLDAIFVNFLKPQDV
jgi:acyl carrier protein